MNKTKMKFMQNAPPFVVFGGFGALAFFAICGAMMCFTDEWKFGLYAICLCITAILFLLWAIKRFERIYKTPISEAMARDKKYWESHDK